MSASANASIQRPDLGYAFEEWDALAAAQGFIGLEILPPIEVGISRGNFEIIPREAYFKQPNTRRAPDGSYSRSDWEYEQVSFACEERGHEERIDDRTRSAIAYTGIDLELSATKRAMIFLMRELEILIAQAVFGTGGGLTANDVTNEWDTTNGKPIADVMDAINSFKNQCGLMPTHLVISDTVLRNLQTNAQIVDRIKAHGNGPQEDARRVTIQALSEIFGVQLLVPMGSSNVKDTKGEGLDSVLTDLWDDEYALLFHRAGADGDPQGPGLGRTFNFSELSAQAGDYRSSAGGGAVGAPIVEMYREETRRADIVRARLDYDVKLIDLKCAYLMGNISS